MEINLCLFHSLAFNIHANHKMVFLMRFTWHQNRGVSLLPPSYVYCPRYSIQQEEYPAIRREAKAIGATIYFGDEAGVRSDYHSGTSWAPKGKTPVIRTTGSRHSLNLVSAISARGNMRFMTVKGKMTADTFITFLERLLKNQKAPVFLIVDGHPVHRSNRVKIFVAATEGKLKLFHLPAYSPELNLDEQVWNQLKNHRIGKLVLKSLDDMKNKVHSAMRSIQRSPDLIRSFFRHKDCLYAAE